MKLKNSMIFGVLLTLFLLFSSHTSFADPRDFGPATLERYLDDFMIKSDFNLDTNRYKVFNKVVEGNLIKYKIVSREISYGSIDVFVDAGTNKIVHMRFFVLEPTADNTEINALYTTWLPIITGRYGAPMQIKTTMLYQGDQMPAKYALFKEDGHYKYYFGAFGEPASPARQGILIDITAL